MKHIVTTDFAPKARDFAGTAWINLKLASDTTDTYARLHYTGIARQDLDSAGETLSVDLLDEYTSGHAYFSHIVPVIMAYLVKKYDFA